MSNFQIGAKQMLPLFGSRTDLKRFIYVVGLTHRGQRKGQAICNNFIVSKELECKIYELDNLEVITGIMSEYVR